MRLTLVAASLLAAAPAARARPAAESKNRGPGAEAAATPLRSEVVWVDPRKDLAPDVASGGISSILYVNRCAGGCTITPGVNDSRANTSSLVSQTVVLSEFVHGDEVFDQTIDCLRQVYGPYAIDVVTEDPGDVPHHEAILAGSSDELDLPANVGGVAPAACEPLDNVISFSFSNSVGPAVNDLCWTVAQESAHAFGLPNHVRDCSDPMTYIEGCGRKFFRDRGLPCGDFEAGACRCTDSFEQNSHRTLLEVFGPGEPPPAPVIDISRPADGAEVLDSFDVVVNANDPRLVDRVALFINGTLYESRAGYPYANSTAAYRFIPPALPDGYMTIEIRARNDLRVEGKAAVTVLKGEPCTADSQCLEGQSCNAGACAYPPADRDLGDSCDAGHECTTGLCPARGDQHFCSEYCDPASDFSCPQGFECLEAGNSGVCWPLGASGGCCQVSRGGPLPPASTGLLALLALLGLRRRRRR